MYLHSQTKTQVTLLLDAHEASRVLQGLEEHASLGAEATALAQALRAAGVTPPPAPDHIRMEYAPPLPD